MAKRFTDSEKWDDPFFLDMPNEFKLLYIYILDKCDSVGVWKINKRLAEFCIGKFDWDLFISYMGDRVKIISDEKLWLTKFCSYQYGVLDEESKSPATKSHISRLKSHSLYIDYKKTIARDKVKVKVKAKVKEKVKEEDKEECYSKFAHLKLTMKEYKKLIEDGYSKELIDDKIMKLKNYKKNTNYKSMYLTLINWMKDELNKPSAYRQKEQDQYSENPLSILEEIERRN